MRSLKFLSLIVFITIAGCSAVPFVEPTAQKEPVPVVIENNATLTETFEVAVVDVGANLTVYRGDGKVYNETIGQGAKTITTTSESTIRKIEFPDSARTHGQYTLEPGERKQLSVENVAPDTAIVILIFDEPEGTYRAIHTVSCGGPLLGVKATSRSGGTDDWTTGTHECG